eukprot:scaffold22587_cov70-Cyclotella_meneghiniana.AAC.2
MVRVVNGFIAVRHDYAPTSEDDNQIYYLETTARLCNIDMITAAFGLLLVAQCPVPRDRSETPPPEARGRVGMGGGPAPGAVGVGR